MIPILIFSPVAGRVKSAATARVRMVRRVAETRASVRVRVESLEEDEDIMVLKCEMCCKCGMKGE